MKNNQGQRLYREYQTRQNLVFAEGEKYRGMVGCRYNGASLIEPEYFYFQCEEARECPDDAFRDAAVLFYLLEKTS
jgi:hypothetical protein